MTEKQSKVNLNACIFKNTKKGFAFLTKFHCFNHRPNYWVDTKCFFLKIAYIPGSPPKLLQFGF